MTGTRRNIKQGCGEYCLQSRVAGDPVEEGLISQPPVPQHERMPLEVLHPAPQAAPRQLARCRRVVDLYDQVEKRSDTFLFAGKITYESLSQPLLALTEVESVVGKDVSVQRIRIELNELELLQPELVHSTPAIALSKQAGRWVVRTGTGDQYTSRVVISNVDPALTVCSLLDPSLIPRRALRKASRLRPSGSILMALVGTDLDLAELGFTTGNICQYADWNVASCYDGWLGKSPPSTEKALFINSPSVRDAQGRYAPEGEHTLQLLAGWSYESMERWAPMAPQQRGEEYEQLKTELCDALVAGAERQVPGLASHVTRVECITPLECADRVRSVRGGIYGPAHIPSQMGPGRYQSLTCGVDGLFLAGAGTFGCGLYYCAASGFFAAEKSLAYLTG